MPKRAIDGPLDEHDPLSTATLDEHKTLSKYTGWFVSSDGHRAVITLDYFQLRIGLLAPENEGGVIEASFDMSSLNDEKVDEIMTRAGEPTITFAELKRTITGEPDDEMIIFSIENGEVTGVGFDETAYKRTKGCDDPEECHFLKLRSRYGCKFGSML